MYRKNNFIHKPGKWEPLFHPMLIIQDIFPQGILMIKRLIMGRTLFSRLFSNRYIYSTHRRQICELHLVFRTTPLLGKQKRPAQAAMAVVQAVETGLQTSSTIARSALKFDLLHFLKLIIYNRRKVMTLMRAISVWMKSIQRMKKRIWMRLRA